MESYIKCCDCLDGMKEIPDLQVGKAGEYLVCADLIMQGYIAYLSEQGLRYDIVADINGRLIRIQVKTTIKYKAIPQRKEYIPSYLFNVRRCGKGGRKKYKKNEVDLFAFVALDRKLIGYVPFNKIKTTMTFRVKDFESEYYGNKNETIKKRIKELRNTGLGFTEISKKIGRDRAYAHRVCSGKEETKYFGRYLEDFTFKKALNEINSREKDT